MTAPGWRWLVTENRERLQSYNRPIDCGPESDIFGGIEISMGCKTALMAHEPGLGFPVVLVYIPTGRTCSGSVHGGDEHDGNTGKLRFVGDKCAELKTCPIRMSRFLCLGNRGFRDAAQIFESNTSQSAFGQRDETLGNNVVGVGLEPGLTTLDQFHPTLGRWGAFFLKSSPVRGILEPELLDGIATRVEIPVRIDGEIIYAKIDAEIACVFDLGFLCSLDGDKQKRVPFPEENLGGIGLVLEPDCLLRGHRHIEKLSAVDGPDRSLALAPGEKVVVQSDRTVWFELAILFFLGLITSMDLGNGLNDGAGSKPWKEPPGLVVDEMMELVFVERPGDKSFFRDPIAKFINCPDRLDQIGLWTKQFNFLSQDHTIYGNINRQNYPSTSMPKLWYYC